MFTHLINTLTSPRITFQEITARKRWQDGLTPLIILALVGILSYGLLQELFTDVQMERATSRILESERIPEEQKAQALERYEKRILIPSSTLRALTWISSALSTPIRVLFMALVVMLIGNFIFGGQARYSSIFPLCAHAYLVTVLEQAVKIPLMLSNWSVDVYTGLGLLGLGERGSFLHHFLAQVDLFAFWRIFLLSIAMAVQYQKRTRPFLLALLVFWALQMILTAAVNAAFS